MIFVAFETFDLENNTDCRKDNLTITVGGSVVCELLKDLHNIKPCLIPSILCVYYSMKDHRFAEEKFLVILQQTKM